MVAVSFSKHSGDVPRTNAPGCPTTESCYPYSSRGLGVDFFFDSTADDQTLDHGLWIGQDIGYAKVDGDQLPYGITSVGYAWSFNFHPLHYFLGLGYGVSYATLDSKRYALQDSTNDGPALITGIEYSPFPLSHLVGLGMMFTFKASPYLPSVYDKDQITNRRYYEPSISSTFGIVFRLK